VYPDPGPPHRDEEAREDQEAAEARILGKPVRELGNRDDEDEVEEELQPGRMAFVVVVLEGPQPGRVVPARGHARKHAAHRHPAALDLASLVCYIADMRSRDLRRANHAMPEALFGFLVFGGGALVLGGGIAYALGPSPRRMLGTVALGILAALGLFLWVWLESSPTEACWECGQILGRWMSPLISVFLVWNVLVWTGAALAGWAIRRMRQPGPSGP
jgi:hypothetical protein